MEEHWFVFTAYNSEARYGFGTEAEADKYCDVVLNRSREVNLYGARILMDANILAAFEKGSRSDGFCLDEELTEALTNGPKYLR